MNLYHVTKFSPYFSFTVYCFYTKISSFMLVLSTRIVLDLFYLLIFHSEKFSTDVCRLPYAVNVNLNLSISMSHSSLSSLCNELEHTRRIRGWAYLKKVHFLPNELADKENSTCMHERIMRDILLIFNEFIVAPLWFMCSYFQYPQFKIFEIEIRRYFPLQINRHLICKRVSLTCIYSIRLCYANSIPCIDKRNIFFTLYTNSLMRHVTNCSFFDSLGPLCLYSIMFFTVIVIITCSRLMEAPRYGLPNSIH